MKRAKQMQTLAKQRYERQVMKGLKDLDDDRVVSHEEFMTSMDLHLTVLEAKQGSGGMLFKRRARSWWKPSLSSLEDIETDE